MSIEEARKELVERVNALIDAEGSTHTVATAVAVVAVTQAEDDPLRLTRPKYDYWRDRYKLPPKTGKREMIQRAKVDQDAKRKRGEVGVVGEPGVGPLPAEAADGEVARMREIMLDHVSAADNVRKMGRSIASIVESEIREGTVAGEDGAVQARIDELVVDEDQGVPEDIHYGVARQAGYLVAAYLRGRGSVSTEGTEGTEGKGMSLHEAFEMVRHELLERERKFLHAKVVVFGVLDALDDDDLCPEIVEQGGQV